MSICKKPAFAKGSVWVLLGMFLAPVLAGQLADKEKRPDLVVSEWTVSAPPRFDGDRIIVPVSVTVQNRGSGAAGEFQVSFFRQFPGKAAAEEPQPAEPAAAVKSLAARASVTLTRGLNVGTRARAGETVKLRAVADGGGRVAESDDRNNSSAVLSIGLPAIVTMFRAPADLTPMPRLKAATVARTFTPQERIPDLAVSAGEIDVTWCPLYDRSERYLGQSPTVLVMVRNAGDGAARNVVVSAELLDATGNPLGQSTAYTAPGDTLPGGFWLCEIRGFWRGTEYVYLSTLTNVVFRVTVDPGNRIEERNEGNNTADKISHVVRY